MRGRLFLCYPILRMFWSNRPGPLHRTVLGEAFRAAWHERRLWIFALFAGILQTGGIYDVIAASIRQISLSIQGASRTWFWAFGSPVGNQLLAISLKDYASGRFLIGGFIVLVLLLCSLLSQSALVVGASARLRGHTMAWKDLMAVGFRHLWSVFLLNIITLGAIGIARAFLFIPFFYAARLPSILNVLGSIIAFVLFVFAVVFFTSLHLFSLQFIAVQENGVIQALFKSFWLFKKAWLVVLEKGLLLLVIGFGLLIAGFLAFLLLSLPWMLLLVAALLLQNAIIATVGWALLLLAFLAAMGLIGMFAITFQYAAWDGVFRRVSGNSAMAKLHRFFRWLMEEFHLVRPRPEA